MLCLNTKGLTECGITRDTPDKDAKGGVIERDSHRNPTGVLKEPPAMQLAYVKIPALDVETLKKQAFEALQDYSESGFTTVADMGSLPLNSDPILKFMSSLTSTTKCPIRMAVYYQPEFAPSSEKQKLFTNNKLWFPGIKMFADGSPYACSMAIELEEPFPENRITNALGRDADHPSGNLSYESP